MSDPELREALTYASQQDTLWTAWAREKMKSLLEWMNAGKEITCRQRAFALDLLSKDCNGLPQK